MSIVSLSSGEAEFYGIVKAGSVGLGVRSLLEDLHVKAKINVFTDASVAKGISHRKGLGKVKHLEI